MVITKSEESTATLIEFDRGYYGWRVVIAACLGVMVGFGSLFVYTFSVFMKPLGAEFGWGREAISRGFGLAALSMAIWSPLLGQWLDRFGPRRVILPCLTIYGCAIASLAFLRPHLWQFYLICILLGTIGNGAAHLAFSRAISTWFHHRLGLALAMVMAGAGLGSMILPFFAQTIISRAGWRAAYLSLGSLALAVGLPMTWRYIHERAPIHHDSPTALRPGPTWQQGLRSFPFWIIVTVLVVNSVAMNGTVTHLAALLTDRGISARGAALSASLLGGSSLLGRLVIGWVLDRLFGACCLRGFLDYRRRGSAARAGGYAGDGLHRRGDDRSGRRRRGGHYSVSLNALLRSTRLLHSLRHHLDFLCHRGRNRTGDFGSGV